MTTRNGNWIETFTGVKFYPFDPKPGDIRILDIAHSLSMQCRYNGHCGIFYSVAEHSVILARMAPDEFALPTLLHDSAEYVFGDMLRPIKLSMPEYCSAEDVLLEMIWGKYLGTVSEECLKEIKRLDSAILVDERRQLMTDSGEKWDTPEEGLGVKISGWAPHFAKTEFLEMFFHLSKGGSDNEFI